MRKKKLNLEAFQKIGNTQSIHIWYTKYKELEIYRKITEVKKENTTRTKGERNQGIDFNLLSQNNEVKKGIGT